jgi:meso-butanediol dehydrogenase/(S,S)-butanediol dehydrogenase/diacetyl reductase
MTPVEGIHGGTVAGRLEGRVALVTGGGPGIGAAVARRFARAGASVVVTGRRPGPIGAVAREVGGVAVQGDVRDDRHLREAVATAVERFGGLDVVVANAGTSGGGDVGALDDREWARVLDTNLTGVMRTARAALPALLDRGGGSIVVVSSVAGLLAGPASAAYDTSKAGLLGLVRSMALDLGPRGVRVNAVCPGWVRSEMSEREMDALGSRLGIDRDEAYEVVSRHLPLRRVAEPEEIAACVLFLASEEASYVTGAILVADGGGAVVDVASLPFAPG